MLPTVYLCVCVFLHFTYINTLMLNSTAICNTYVYLCVHVRICVCTYIYSNFCTNIMYKVKRLGIDFAYGDAAVSFYYHENITDFLHKIYMISPRLHSSLGSVFLLSTAVCVGRQFRFANAVTTVDQGTSWTVNHPCGVRWCQKTVQNKREVDSKGIRALFLRILSIST